MGTSWCVQSVTDRAQHRTHKLSSPRSTLSWKQRSPKLCHYHFMCSNPVLCTRVRKRTNYARAPVHAIKHAYAPTHPPPTLTHKLSSGGATHHTTPAPADVAGPPPPACGQLEKCFAVFTRRSPRRTGRMRPHNLRRTPVHDTRASTMRMTVDYAVVRCACAWKRGHTIKQQQPGGCCIVYI